MMACPLPTPAKIPPVAHQIQPGDELQCPHCRRWHPVMARHTEGTEYTRPMFY